MVKRALPTIIIACLSASGAMADAKCTGNSDAFLPARFMFSSSIVFTIISIVLSWDRSGPFLIRAHVNFDKKVLFCGVSSEEYYITHFIFYIIYITSMASLKTAYETLEKQLLSGVWTPGSRLPSLSALASQHGVCRTTMWRAIGLLQKRSLVHARKRGAIIAGPDGSETFETTRQSYGWQRLKDTLSKDAINGRFEHNKLPPTNKLALQYGVAVNTLRKSLAALCAEGFLVQNGKAFHLSQSGRLSRSQSMVLISSGERVEGELSIDLRLQRLIESFEGECFRLGYESRIESLNIRTPKGLLSLSATLIEIPDIAGCLLHLWDFGNRIYWQRWIDAIHYLLSRNIPVIAIDQDGGLVFPNDLLKHPQFKVLRISGIRSGKAVGAALYKQGHKKLAFIAPFFELSWVQNRYAGLKKFYSEFGGKGASVQIFSLAEGIGQPQLSLALLGITKKEVSQLYQNHHSPEQLQNLLSDMETSRSLDLAKRLKHEPSSNIAHDAARFLLEQTNKEHDPVGFEILLSALEKFAADRSRLLYLEPVFDQARSAGFGTTWVCADDQIALDAFQHLTNKKIKIPDEIALQGFDNWHESVERNISSYDFNMHGMIQQALLLITDEKRLKAQPAIGEVEGYVVERKTTRR